MQPLSIPFPFSRSSFKQTNLKTEKSRKTEVTFDSLTRPTVLKTPKSSKSMELLRLWSKIRVQFWLGLLQHFQLLFHSASWFLSRSVGLMHLVQEFSCRYTGVSQQTISNQAITAHKFPQKISFFPFTCFLLPLRRFGILWERGGNQTTSGNKIDGATGEGKKKIHLKFLAVF